MNDAFASMSLSPMHATTNGLAKKRSQRFTVQTHAMPSLPPPLPLPSNASSEDSYTSSGLFPSPPQSLRSQYASPASTVASSMHTRQGSNPMQQIWQTSVSPPLPADSLYANKMNSSPWYESFASSTTPQEYHSGTTSAYPQQYFAQPTSDNNTPALVHPNLLPGQEDANDEVISTALVLKNIPFTVTKENLLFIIESLQLIPPYALNLHYDIPPVAGQPPVFRGLAFANFRTPEECTNALAALNGYEVQGRRLRVEYKRMLRIGEKEKIEREKAIKRMKSLGGLQNATGRPNTSYSPAPQSPARNHDVYTHQQQQQSHYDEFDEDYGQVITSDHTQNWLSSNNSAALGSPSKLAFPTDFASSGSVPSVDSFSPPNSDGYQDGYGLNSQANMHSTKMPRELDMNDPQTLEIYSRVLLFKDDNFRDELAFARSLSVQQRRLVHLVAQKLGLEHRSAGDGDERCVIVSKGFSSSRIPPSAHNMARRSASNLRAKKSMPEMRRDSPSPQIYSNLTARKSNNDLRSANSPRRPDRSSYMNGFHGGALPPPVPSLPRYPSEDTFGSALRQPRGPDMNGKTFGRAVQADSWRPQTDTNT